MAAFWFNPTETFIDVEEGSQGKRTHWISEAGLADLFLMPGPNVRSLYAQYAEMTGTSQLPPTFSLGYHQCRWNYRDEADVKAVDSKFEELDFPYDVIWLDIEHTNSKKYFTWDHNLFPPKEMIDEVASRKKSRHNCGPSFEARSYRIHNEAKVGTYVRDKSCPLTHTDCRVPHHSCHSREFSPCLLTFVFFLSFFFLLFPFPYVAMFFFVWALRRFSSVRP